MIQLPGTNGVPQPIAISVLVIRSSVLTDRKQNWSSSQLLKWSKGLQHSQESCVTFYLLCVLLAGDSPESPISSHTTLSEIKWKKRRKGILWRSRCEYSSLWLRTEEAPGIETSSRSPVDSFEAEEYLKLRWTYKKQFNEAQKGRWCRSALWTTAGMWAGNSLHCCPSSVATPLFITPTMLPRPSLVITPLVCYHAHHLLPNSNLRFSVNLKNRMRWDTRCKNVEKHIFLIPKSKHWNTWLHFKG